MKVYEVTITEVQVHKVQAETEEEAASLALDNKDLDSQIIFTNCDVEVDEVFPSKSVEKRVKHMRGLEK